MNNRCCICVINYKTKLMDYEQLSLLRIIDFCIQSNRLGDLIFIMPTSNIKTFDDFCETYINKFVNDKFGIIYNFKFMHYDDDAFCSLNAYNNMLMLNKNFYGDFLDSYDYMLIYQLDAYIFNDQLNYFLNENYDYIGGYYLPLYVDSLKYNNFNNLSTEQHLIMNGGVSLKKISFCIDSITKHYDKLIKGCEFNNVFSYINEDTYFSMFYETKVNAIESMKFSLNWAGAENYWAIINFDYPFCCHGIQHSQFLMKLIEKYNKENNLEYSNYVV